MLTVMKDDVFSSISTGVITDSAQFTFSFLEFSCLMASMAFHFRFFHFGNVLRFTVVSCNLKNILTLE